MMPPGNSSLQGCLLPHNSPKNHCPRSSSSLTCSMKSALIIPKV
jgi:hypothetical protein